MLCIFLQWSSLYHISHSPVTDGEVWMIAVLKSLKQDPAQEVETRIAEFSRSNEWATMHDMDSKIVAQDNR